MLGNSSKNDYKLFKLYLILVASLSSFPTSHRRSLYISKRYPSTPFEVSYNRSTSSKIIFSTLLKELITPNLCPKQLIRTIASYRKKKTALCLGSWLRSRSIEKVKIRQTWPRQVSFFNLDAR